MLANDQVDPGVGHRRLGYFSVAALRHLWSGRINRATTSSFILRSDHRLAIITQPQYVSHECSCPALSEESMMVIARLLVAAKSSATHTKGIIIGAGNQEGERETHIIFGETQRNVFLRSTTFMRRSLE